MSERTDEERVDVEEESDYDTNPREKGKWVSGLIALAGVWLVFEALWWDALLLGNVWNDIIVGLLLVALGGYNYYQRANEEAGSAAAAGLSALLGLWLIVSPFVYDLEVAGAELTTELGFWNDVVVGLLVLALGAYSAYEARDVDVGATTAER
jgi:thiol:disulfide interchange protein